MPPLTRELLAANAFRTLGLPATADQAAVDAAARRLRLWPDPARIPPTPWDVPWLGPLRRARPDVENAVARLADPTQRVAERVLWYHGQRPPPLAAAAQTLPADDPDAPLGTLHAAVVIDPDAADVDRWRTVLGGWTGDRDEVRRQADALYAADAAGRFEKAATRAEMAAATAAVPVAIGEHLAARGRAALDAGDADRCQSLVALVAATAAGRRTVADLVDRIEDLILARCGQVDHDLRDVLRTNHANPRPFWARNEPPTRRAADAYNATVNPQLNAFCTMIAKADVDADADAGRLVRVRSKCADLLILVALGWEWSGEYATAVSTLTLAAELAVGSTVAFAVDEALARVRPLAGARPWTTQTPARPAAQPTTSTPGRPAPARSAPARGRRGPAAAWFDRLRFGTRGNRRPLWFALCIAIYASRFAFQGSWSTPNATPDVPSDLPTFPSTPRYPSHDLPSILRPLPADGPTLPPKPPFPPGPPLHVGPLSRSAGEVNRDP